MGEMNFIDTVGEIDQTEAAVRDQLPDMNVAFTLGGSDGTLDAVIYIRPGTYVKDMAGFLSNCLAVVLEGTSDGT